MDEPFKRLYVDIETSYNICASWRIGNRISLSPENILWEREIIMIGYRWEGSKERHVLCWDWKEPITLQWPPVQKSRDLKMLKEFSKVYAQADEIIAHNGKGFDLPWIRTRIWINQLPPLPPTKVHDTLLLTRGGFNFNSNRLDYLSKMTGGKGKLKTEYNWWHYVTLNGDTKLLNKMIRYCKRDVDDLYEFDQQLLKYTPTIVNSRRIKDGIKNCVECIKKGIKNTLVDNGWAYTTATRKKRYKCKKCGKPHYSNTREYL